MGNKIYRYLMKRVHPDICGNSEESIIKSQLINRHKEDENYLLRLGFIWNLFLEEPERSNKMVVVIKIKNKILIIKISEEIVKRHKLKDQDRMPFSNGIVSNDNAVSIGMAKSRLTIPPLL